VATYHNFLGAFKVSTILIFKVKIITIVSFITLITCFSRLQCCSCITSLQAKNSLENEPGVREMILKEIKNKIQ